MNLLLIPFCSSYEGDKWLSPCSM